MRLEISTECTQLLSQKLAHHGRFSILAPRQQCVMARGAVHVCMLARLAATRPVATRGATPQQLPHACTCCIQCFLPRGKGLFALRARWLSGGDPSGSRIWRGGGVGVSRPNRSAALPRASTAPVRQRAAHAVPPLETDRGQSCPPSAPHHHAPHRGFSVPSSLSWRCFAIGLAPPPPPPLPKGRVETWFSTLPTCGFPTLPLPLRLLHPRSHRGRPTPRYFCHLALRCRWDTLPLVFLPPPPSLRPFYCFVFPFPTVSRSVSHHVPGTSSQPGHQQAPV